MAGLAPSAVAGRLRAEFCADGSVAVQSEAPLELRGPFLRDGARFFYLRNMTTGIFGGDRYDVSLRSLPGASVQVASSSATKAYEALGAQADVSVHIEALASSRIVWGPHATILQAGALLRQRLVCRVHEDASVVLAEVVGFGRRASHEGLCFVGFESELVVESPAGQPMYEERYVLKPCDDLEATLGGYGALAGVYVLGRGLHLEATLRDVCASGGLCGFSALPSDAGWVVKGLTASLSEATALTNAVLRAINDAS